MQYLWLLWILARHTLDFSLCIPSLHHPRHLSQSRCQASCRCRTTTAGSATQEISFFRCPLVSSFALSLYIDTYMYLSLSHSHPLVNQSTARVFVRMVGSLLGSAVLPVAPCGCVSMYSWRAGTSIALSLSSPLSFFLYPESVLKAGLRMWCLCGVFPCRERHFACCRDGDVLLLSLFL